MQGKTAIIGDYDSVLAFKAGGVDVYGVSNLEQAKDTLKKIAKKYAVIFITDDIAQSLDEYLKRFLESAFPVILPIPSKNGSNGYSKNKMKEQMEKALGVDILFRNEEKDNK